MITVQDLIIAVNKGREFRSILEIFLNYWKEEPVKRTGSDEEVVQKIQNNVQALLKESLSTIQSLEIKGRSGCFDFDTKNISGYEFSLPEWRAINKTVAKIANQELKKDSNLSNFSFSASEQWIRLERNVEIT